MWNAKTTCSALLTLAIPFSAHALNIGPVVETKIIIIEPGNPVQIVEDKTITVKVKPVDVDTPPAKITKNISGWVLITPNDWAVYKRRLKAFSFVEKHAPDLAKQAKDEVSKEAVFEAPPKKEGIIRS